MLADNGHEARVLKDVLATDTPDQIVAAICERNGEVLISFDKDFKALTEGVSRRRFPKLHRIHMRCKEPDAAARLESALGLVELEWRLFRQKKSQKVHLEILGHGLKIFR